MGISPGRSVRRSWCESTNSEPPLEPRDLTALGKGYSPFAANDELRGGAFSYLRSEHSPIDRIFVTGDLSPSEERYRFFHVAKERTVDKFIRKIADNRPVVMRLSLGGSKAATSERAVEESLQTVFGVPEFQLESGDGWATGLTSAGLTKPIFLSTKREQFTRLRAEINARLTNQYGAGMLPLTSVDLWVIIFAEAGIKCGGFVNPEAQHSLGERGLLPLPANVTFWNGADAPRWDRLMPLATNLFHYALYLGQLKNKPVTTVGGRTLYRDLFRVAGIVDTAERQANCSRASCTAISSGRITAGVRCPSIISSTATAGIFRSTRSCAARAMSTPRRRYRPIASATSRLPSTLFTPRNREDRAGPWLHFA